MHMKNICLAICVVFLAGFLSAETITDADRFDFKPSFVGLESFGDNYVYVYEIDTAKDLETADFTVERKFIQVVIPKKDEPSLAVVEGKTIDYLNSERQTIKEKLEVKPIFAPVSEVSLERIVAATKSTVGETVLAPKQIESDEGLLGWLKELLGW
jgi:hypothetical protein